MALIDYWPFAALTAQLARLDAHISQLEQRIILLQQLGATMAGELDALTAEVAQDADVMHSAITLLGNLHDMLVAAGTDPAKLAALTQTLANERTALAEAITANTPAA